MKILLALATAAVLFASCDTPVKEEAKTAAPAIEGTWMLLSGTLIEKNDTTVTNYKNDKSFIKIINGDHFAFLGHDLSHGKDSAAFFTSGGGKYELHDSSYTEHLEYCNDRQWEGNDFNFTIHISGDTLIQAGIEKIDSIGVNRLNIERYVRMK